MALIRPVHVGKEAILDAFDTLSKAGDQVFAVWYNDREIAFQCSMDAATQRDILESNLEALDRSGNTDILYLKMYPATTNGWIDTKTKAVSNTPIQVCEYKGAVGAVPMENQPRPAGMSYEAWEMLKGFKDIPGQVQAKLLEIDEKIALLTALEEEEPEVNQIDQTMGMINGLTNNPVVMQLVTKLLEFFNRPVTPAIYQPTIGMAETTAPPAPQQRIPFNEDEMNSALDILSYHCDLGACLQKLAQMAQSNPGQFKMYLNIIMNS